MTFGQELKLTPCPALAELAERESFLVEEGAREEQLNDGAAARGDRNANAPQFLLGPPPQASITTFIIIIIQLV